MSRASVVNQILLKTGGDPDDESHSIDHQHQVEDILTNPNRKSRLRKLHKLLRHSSFGWWSGQFCKSILQQAVQRNLLEIVVVLVDTTRLLAGAYHHQDTSAEVLWETATTYLDIVQNPCRHPQTNARDLRVLGQSVVSVAILSDAVDVVNLLLRQLGVAQFMNCAGPLNPLEQAVLWDSVNTVELLLRQGLQVHHPGHFGLNIVEFAIIVKSLSSIRGGIDTPHPCLTLQMQLAGVASLVSMQAVVLSLDNMINHPIDWKAASSPRNAPLTQEARKIAQSLVDSSEFDLYNQGKTMSVVETAILANAQELIHIFVQQSTFDLHRKVNKKDQTVLEMALVKGTVGVVGLLVRHCPEFDFHATSHDDQLTAIQFAIREGSMEAVEALADHSGFDLERCFPDGSRVLQYCIDTHNKEALFYFMDQFQVTPLGQATEGGHSIFSYAMCLEQLQLIKCFLQHSTLDPNSVVDDVPLFVSCMVPIQSWGEHNVIQLTQAFLAHPNFNINQCDQTTNQSSILMHAVKKGLSSVVEALLLCQALEVNMVDKEGCNALMVLLASPDLRRQELAVNLLLKRPELNLCLQNNDGKTASAMARENSSINVANMVETAHCQQLWNLVNWLPISNK